MNKFPIKNFQANQLVRFVAVGIVTNAIGYAIYLLITHFWIKPKFAITLFYLLGAFLGYFSHARYSFYYNGENYFVIAKYILAYAVGYFVNLVLLHVLFEQLNYPHQVVQAIAIPVVAVLMYLLLGRFVYTHSDDRTSM